MEAEINIKLVNEKLYIQEENCIQIEYKVSKDMPAMIDDICEYLHDYLEGLG